MPLANTDKIRVTKVTTASGAVYHISAEESVFRKIPARPNPEWDLPTHVWLPFTVALDMEIGESLRLRGPDGLWSHSTPIVSIEEATVPAYLED